MSIHAVGQGALSAQLEYLEQIKKEQQAGKASPLPPPGTPANIDRVNISPLATVSLSATPPAEKPTMFKMFSEDIEAGIGRIENILRNARFDQVAGSMLAAQRSGVINDPEKGVLGKNEEMLKQQTQKFNAKKEMEFASKSVTSGANASLSAIVKTIGDEQKNRNAQVQSAAQLVH